MTRRAARPDFGDRATGTVVDEHDWGPSGPRIITPRRVVSGTVVGLFGEAPAVVKVQTGGGEILCIRITGPRRRR